MSLTERGRYLAILGGCNDCHTPGFAQSGGTTPESEWLTGVPVGWRGPWGTTYALNLRLFVNSLSENAWIQLAHTIRANPPMPFWTLNAMTKQDLRAIYQYIKMLGPKGGATPATSRPVTSQ